ncbi:hypothetical protein O0235_09530 [Tepidiforma flava]|uniref:N-terminal of MaoC-like dehydratase domain-containing protein n=1 Tax=Tepidiforma flava TaxID=3004094 RepID=A0ABY7M309_9CHLR|nr:hypothetical protein [Tepidiforma flava]WBL35026.1 hypothetical protein O0235_09530 [Tepidiforma flava]
MPEESLLTDAVRALVGRETRLGRVQVTARAFRRAHEVYAGGPPARVPARRASRMPGYVITGLESESEAPAFPDLLPNSLLIANEWSFERPLRMGEWLEMVHRVTDVRERFGAAVRAYSIDVLSETAFYDAAGRLAARSGRTMTQYSAAEAVREGARSERGAVRPGGRGAGARRAAAGPGAGHPVLRAGSGRSRRSSMTRRRRGRTACRGRSCPGR